MNYIPTEYSVKPGLQKLEENHLVIDDQYNQYLADKADAWEVDQCYINNEADEVTAAAHHWLKDTLKKEYGWTAFGYNFEQLCMQIQEDVCVMQNDSLVIAHVCFPSWWNPLDKMGMSMSEIHGPVPGMDKTKYEQIWKACLHKGPYLRHNWTLTDSSDLNQHPSRGIGKDFDGEELYLRVERQVLVGLPKVDSVVFLIRTFVNKIDELNCCERAGIAIALNKMTDKELEYKGLTDKKESVILCLS